ncbi:hypothetical protein SAMN05421640_3681 [Ekhidna lutea]|uniref:Uncharacterized protein n=1 Tax=Ekhidna lutea TaxID=447679 RepID=A0A239M662_EKHLU|nr:hypothetical protein SAMN05421640_3681 [Ekhidna lutea]
MGTIYPSFYVNVNNYTSINSLIDPMNMVISLINGLGSLNFRLILTIYQQKK